MNEVGIITLFVGFFAMMVINTIITALIVLAAMRQAERFYE